MVPLCDLKIQYTGLRQEIDVAIREVCASGNYILGPNTEALEKEMADYLGCRYAVGLNSGTDALHLALRALDIGPGDEVITTAFTFVATTEAIGLVGATPVFVDIDPATFNIDPRRVADAITPRTKAILPVHLFGWPCDMDALGAIAERHGLELIEDCAQATGAVFRGRQVGSWGRAGCFSFFPSKNLGCFGDGGLLATNDLAVYDRVESLRRHGGKVKYHHDELGLNSRLDELQAAVLRIKLRHLDQWNALRREAARGYQEMLADMDDVQLPVPCLDDHEPTQGAGPTAETRGVYNQFTIRIEHRDQVAASLRRAGVGCAVYYPVPLHLQRVHQELGYQRGDLPHTEAAAQRCLSIPMYPGLTRTDQQFAVDTLWRAMRHAERVAA